MFGTKAAVRYILCLVLAYLFAFETVQAQLKFRFPMPGQTFYPDRVLRLEWSTDASQAVDVLFTQDSGVSWRRLAAGIQDSAFDWRLPLLDTAPVIFKIQQSELRLPEEFQRIRHDRGCVSACWDATDHYIISTLDSSVLELRSPDNLLAMATLAQGSPALIPAQSYVQHPDTSISAQGKELILINIASFGEAQRFGGEVHRSDILCLSTHPTKPVVASATADGRVYLWSIPDRRLIRVFGSEMHAAVRTVRFSQDGRRILYAGDEGIVYVRDCFDTSAPVIQLRGHGDGTQSMAVLSADFCPDGRYLVSAGVDYTIRQWDLQYEYCKYIMYGHSGPVTSIKVSSDGTRILSGSLDSTVRQWSVAAARELHPALKLGDAVSAVDYTIGADTLLACERNSGTTVLWKNLRENGVSDSVNGYISYPISVRICNTKAQVGELGTIPIVFDSLIHVPFFERSSFRARIGLTLPRRIVAIETTDPEFEILHGEERDTVYMPILFSSNDTIGRIPVRFLLSNDASDQVQILGGYNALQWSNNVRAFVLDHTTNGIVSSEKECPQTARGGLSMLALSDAQIYPSPADEHAKLNFSSYEEGSYRIDVLNELGSSVYQLLDANLGRLAQTIDVPTSHLSSGNYYVRIQAPSSTTIRPLLVIH